MEGIMRNETRWVAGALHWLLTGLGVAAVFLACAGLAMGTAIWLSPAFHAKMIKASIADGVSADVQARIVDGTLFPMTSAGLLVAALLVWLLWRIVGRVRRS